MISIVSEIPARAFRFNSVICKELYVCLCLSSGFPQYSVVVGEVCA